MDTNQSAVQTVFQGYCSLPTELVQIFRNTLTDTSSTWVLPFGNPGLYELIRVSSICSIQHRYALSAERQHLFVPASSTVGSSVRLGPVTAGAQRTAPICPTRHSAKIKTAEKASLLGSRQIPPLHVRAVLVLGNEVIAAPRRAAQCSQLLPGHAKPCWEQSCAGTGWLHTGHVGGGAPQRG